MKNILIAPDSFKESLSAKRVSEIISEVLTKKALENNIEIKCHLLPLADGGEGTVDVAVTTLGAKINSAKVCGPLVDSHREINAEFAYNEEEQLAVIEMAKAAGIEILINEYEEKRNPNYTTTYGVGELILEAKKKGAKEILIGIGSSITCDAGLGMLQALGAKIIDKNNNIINDVITPSKFENIDKIDLSNAIDNVKSIKIKVLCDVKNSLLGSNGAEQFNLQKISKKYSSEEKIDIIKSLQKNLIYILSVLKKSNENIPDDKMEGMGAAGGLGFGLACLGGVLLPGAKTIIEYSDFDNLLPNADLIITGEGLVNQSTLKGKLPFTVLKLTKEKYPEKKVIFVSGGNELEESEYTKYGIDNIFSIVPEVCSNVVEAITNAEKYLKELLNKNIIIVAI